MAQRATGDGRGPEGPAPGRPPATARPGLRLAGVAVVAVLLVVAVLALRAQFDAVGGLGGLPGPGIVAVALVANVVGNLLLADAWRAILAATGLRLPLGVAGRVWTVSQFARYSVGAAQVPGRAVAGRRHGIGAAAGALTALVEIAWGTSLTAVVALATAPAWLPGSGDLGWVAATAVVPAAVVVVGLVAPQQLLTGLGRLAATRPLRRLGGGRLAGGLGRVTIDRRTAAAVSGRFALVVLTRVVAVVALATAVGADPVADGPRLAGAWALGQVLGQLAVVVPGGLGVREGITLAVAAPALGVAGAALLAALVRLAEIGAEFLTFGLVRLLPAGGAAPDGGRGPGTPSPTAAEPPSPPRRRRSR